MSPRHAKRKERNDSKGSDVMSYEELLKHVKAVYKRFGWTLGSQTLNGTKLRR
jgi:hypothetical protein